MNKYRKKPVVVDVWGPWRGLLSEEVPPDGVGLHGVTVERCQQCHSELSSHLTINTLEGVMLACPGDYIIRGVQGELYPCKPDIFHQTYDAVE